MRSIRLGVAPRLIGGLATITILAITTSVLAIFGFTRMQDGFRLMAESQLPTLTTVSDLARQSESIIANATALAVANSHPLRRTVTLRMEDQVSQFEGLTTRLLDAGVDPESLNQLRDLRGDVVVNLEKIDGLVERRLNANVEAGKIASRVLEVGGRIQNAESRLLMAGRPGQDSSSEWLATSDAIRRWARAAQRAVSLMLVGQSVDKMVRLKQVRKATAGALEEATSYLPVTPAVVAAELGPIHEEIVVLASGDVNFFNTLENRIKLDRHVRGLLSRNRSISDQFVAVVSTLLYGVQERILKNSRENSDLIARETRTITIISIVCVLGALMMFGYVNGSVVRRLTLLQESMSAHASGRTVEISISGSDEIADMGRSLKFFVDTIRKREQALKESEQRLLDAVESISEGFALWDADDRLVLCNSSYRNILYAGMEDLAVPGTPFETIVRTGIERGIIEDAGDDIDAWIAKRHAERRNPTGPIERRRSRDRWLLINERKTQDGGLVGVYTDITDRKKAEQAIREKSDILQLNQVITRAANEATSVEDALQIALREVCDHSGWPVGHAYLLADDSNRELRPTGLWYLDDPAQFRTFQKVTDMTTFTSGVGLPGRVLASGEPAWITDVTKDPNFPRAQLVTEIGVKAGFAFPVLTGSEVAAVLEFFSDEAVEPDESFLEVMTQIGTQLGRVIERKRAEEALRESEQLLTTILDRMPNIVFLRDCEGRFLLINHKYEEIFEVSKDAVRGKSLHEIHSKSEAEHIIQYDREVIEQKRMVEYELTIVRGGRKYILEAAEFPILDATGKVVAVGGVDHDITERQRAAEKLEKANKIIRDQKQRMEDELNIGKEIQMSMLPLVFPPFPDHHEFSIYAMLEPAREVAGDFYDFFFIDDERFCVCIGDVSGKGVPSALFMAVTKTLIKSRSMDDFSTAGILTHVNAELSSNNNSCMFVTIFLGILNIRTGQLTYTNAGHNPPYVKRGDGSLQRLDTVHGPVLGALSGMVYEEESTMLSSRDLLFMYTDGVTEERNADRQLFSEKRLVDLLASQTNESVKATVQDMISAVNDFKGETEQSDDITVLGLQFLATPAVEPVAIVKMVVTNDLSELANVKAKFSEFSREHNLPATVSRKMRHALDDLLNNVISYAFRDDGEHEIEIKVELANNRLTVTISDDGVPFNPLRAQAPDTSLSLDEREAGGLGVHLVRNMVDEISYQRRIDRNLLSMAMHITRNESSS